MGSTGRVLLSPYILRNERLGRPGHEFHSSTRRDTFKFVIFAMADGQSAFEWFPNTILCSQLYQFVESEKLSPDIPSGHYTLWAKLNNKTILAIDKSPRPISELIKSHYIHIFQKTNEV